MRVLVCLLAVLCLSASVAPAAMQVFGGNGPNNLLAPQLTGDPRVGGTLTCARGTWDDSDREPYDVQYTWLRGDGTIPDEHAATHTVTAVDVGWNVACQVVARDRWRSNGASSRWITLAAPVSLTAPALTGDDRLGGELTCTSGRWDDRGLAQPYPLTYAWQRDGEPIDDALSSRYTVTRDDIGQPLTCVVTAAEAGSAESGAAYPDGPRNGTPPQLGGDPRVGGTVTCSPGTWDSDLYAFTYAWRPTANRSPWRRVRATVVNVVDVAKSLTCEVTAQGLTVVSSAPAQVNAPANRGLPVITGAPRLGSTLSCERDAWDAFYDVTYAWATGSGLPRGTGKQYTVAAGDIQELLVCTATAQGLTPVTASVYVNAPAWISTPVISGDVRVGRTVTCSPAGWDGEYALTTEWRVADQPVHTGTQYTVLAADVGKQLVCDITAAELVTAFGAPRVVPAPRALLPPAISGEPDVGSTLTCRRGTWDEPAGAPYATTYAWQRDGAAAGTGATLVAGAAGSYRCSVGVPGATELSAPVEVTAGGTGSGPFITGTPRIGGTLTCDPGTRTGPITWQPSGTGPTRTLTVADRGLTLTCSVGGVPSAPLSVPSPTPLTGPQISGDGRLGGTLTCVAGAWDGDYAIDFKWWRGATQIGAAATYTVTAADLDQDLTCRTSVADVVYSEAVTRTHALHNQLSPTVAGDPVLGATLTCAPGTWTAQAPRTYAWYRDGQLVAQGQSYQPDTIGAQIACEETLGPKSARSSARTVTEPVNRIAPTITGTPRLKGTLTCGPGTWDAAYTFTYRWTAEGNPVATAATLTPTAVGELTCEVTAAGRTTATSTVERDRAAQPHPRRASAASRGSARSSPAHPAAGTAPTRSRTAGCATPTRSAPAPPTPSPRMTSAVR